MMTAELVREILKIYRKHGWAVESVLLSDSGRAHIGDSAGKLFPDVPVREAAFDAVWFGRPSKKGMKAIELRLLTEAPFAFFEVVDADADEEEVEAVMKEIERKASERASKAFGPGSGH